MIAGIDIFVISLYLLITIIIGLILRKQASKGKANYLLGGNKLPWYMLGLSNASGMFDISGTMWLVTLMFVYGLKSVWIPWLWPVFNQIFAMVYVSKWLRRSNVTTGSEWIKTRFGERRDGELSRNIVAIFAIVSCLAYMAYYFVGLGKFMEIFLPWENISHLVPFYVPPNMVPHMYGFVFILFAVFYSILGGMSGIVWADLLQFTIMLASSVIIAVIGINAVNEYGLIAGTDVPHGWFSPFFDWKLNMDWSGIIEGVNSKIENDQFQFFTVFFLLMIFKGVFASDAGPPPNYDMQKVLATKSPKEASKMSGFVSVVLMPTRYLMISGLAVLGLIFYNKLDLILPNGRLDFEQILPSAIHTFIPVGLVGLILAGLLAAFFSTFAGTLNAAQAYIVNDVYLKHIKPNANNKQIARTSYISGILVVITSIVLGLFTKDVNSILQWIVSGLLGSYVVSNSIRWHWWRFNGYGYFWGMMAGLICAIVFRQIFDFLELYWFPLLFVISAIAAIVGTLATKPTEENVLVNFYKTVKPWGFWKPIHQKVIAVDPNFKKDSTFGKDMFNVGIGIILQTTLVLLPMYFVLQRFLPTFVCLGIALVAAIILKKTWWDKLTD
jgi:Na+/proline symporter